MPEILATTRWHQPLVRLGRRNTIALITGFSVAASLLIVSVFFVLFSGEASDAPQYFIPAVVVPLIVAPLASTWVTQLAFALDEAHRTVAGQAAQLAALFSSSPVGIVALDAAGRVQRHNAAVTALLGEAPSPDPWSARLPDADARAELLDAVRDGRALTARHWRWVRPDGQSRAVEAHVAPLEAAGEGARAMLVLADVTDREALERARAHARQLELVGRLAGGIAHDVNGLLTTVRANLDAVRGGDAEPAIAAIDAAAVSGAQMTRRLLALCGGAVHLPMAQPIAPIVDGALDEAMRQLPPTVQLVRPATWPARAVTVDRDGLGHALINLLLNARDAVPSSGTIDVSVDERVSEGRRWLVITVRDDGIGMSAAVLARATEPFFSTKPAHERTGLGLPLVQATVQRHGGRLVLESTPGAGTSASIWLPDPVAHRAATREDEATPVKAPSTTMPILLVEDEAPVREATARALERLGYAVTAVASVAEARTYLAEQPVALVVSDVMMPEATGLDLLHALRTAGCTTPVLLVSGYASVLPDAALSTDARTGFLPKPWTIGDLGDRVQSLLLASAA